MRKWCVRSVQNSVKYYEELQKTQQLENIVERPKVDIDNLKCRIVRSNILQPYEALANAIVVQAAEDYRMARNYKTDEIEKFFNSEFCASLTNVNPMFILENLRGERNYG